VNRISPRMYPGTWPVILTLSTLAGLLFYPELALVSAILLIYIVIFADQKRSCSLCKDIANKFSPTPLIRNKSIYIPVLIFSLAFLLVIFRDISLLTHPRFWAEDGRHFFEFSYHHNWLDTLLYRPEYQLILSNISALIASRMMPMELAPLPFSLIWLANISAALAIVAWGKSSVWDTALKKIVVCCIIIFAPRTAEIWLNANGSQYYSSLITALILCEPLLDAGRFKKYSFRFLLAIGSLNGVLSCLLTPLYWIKAFKHRNDKEIIIQALILSVGAILQLALILMSPKHAARDILTSVPLFGWITGVKALGLAFSTELSEYIAQIVHLTTTDGKMKTLQVGGLIFVAIWLSLIIFLASKLKNSASIYLLASYILLFVFSSIFGIGGDNNILFTQTDTGNRYYYVPSALILIVTMSLIFLPSAVRYGRSLVIIASLILGLGLLNSTEHFYKHPIKHPSWPDWKKEAAKWEKDHNYILRIWPTGWTINLQQKNIK